MITYTTLRAAAQTSLEDLQEQREGYEQPTEVHYIALYDGSQSIDCVHEDIDDYIERLKSQHGATEGDEPDIVAIQRGQLYDGEGIETVTFIAFLEWLISNEMLVSAEDRATISLPIEHAKKLCSLIGMLTGSAQYMATKDATGALDDTWSFWHGIYKRVSSALGYEAFMEPDAQTNALLTQYVENVKHLETEANQTHEH